MVAAPNAPIAVMPGPSAAAMRSSSRPARRMLAPMVTKAMPPTKNHSAVWRRSPSMVPSLASDAEPMTLSEAIPASCLR
jgi:hypothetical protein